MKPVRELSNRQLRDEINIITKMLGKGSIGSTLASRARISAVINEASRRMRPDTHLAADDRAEVTTDEAEERG